MKLETKQEIFLTTQLSDIQLCRDRMELHEIWNKIIGKIGANHIPNLLFLVIPVITVIAIMIIMTMVITATVTTTMVIMAIMIIIITGVIMTTVIMAIMIVTMECTVTVTT